MVAISTYNVSLTRAMLPVAVRVVEEVEFKRGFGTDQLLRWVGFAINSGYDLIMMLLFCRQSLAELEKTVTQTHT